MKTLLFGYFSILSIIQKSFIPSPFGVNPLQVVISQFELIIKNTIIDSIGAINFVIRHKGDFNLKNVENKTPLDLAIEYKDYRARNLLISLGAKTSEELKNEDS